MHRWKDYAAQVYKAFSSTPTPDRMRERIQGANINEQTLLATDYLNHFNEIAMILELIPDMPEMIEDVRGWGPVSYKDHFRKSSFSDRELAADAYDCVPSAYLIAFEDAVKRTNNVIAEGFPALEGAVATGDRDVIAATTEGICGRIEELMSRMRGIVNGELGTLAQDDIDDILLEADGRVVGEEEAPRATDAALDQNAIDSLFD